MCLRKQRVLDGAGARTVNRGIYRRDPGVGNPKSEIRNPKEGRTTRSSKAEVPGRERVRLRVSDFGIHSGLGFRVSEFLAGGRDRAVKEALGPNQPF